MNIKETKTAKETIERLFKWSSNYESGNNVYCVYLDLIGYSESYYGEKILKNPSECLGYLEYTMLAECLALFENNGYETIYNIIDELTQEQE